MLDFTPNKGRCSGCTACKAICPVSCISMRQDKEGFQYPVSSDECIHCGLCEKVCPIPKPLTTANFGEQEAYAMVSKDYSIWHRSASGGAFSEICIAWGDKSTVIVGAAWDGLRVHHKCVIGIENITELCKSKYISSLPENTFKEILKYLKEERRVIFCGTPCQVAGLKSFLRKDYPNLLTIDLICHGVGSPLVFKDVMNLIGSQYDATVDGYEFRAKRKVFETDYIQRIFTDKGDKYLIRDPYIQLFLSQLCLRPSCGENCVFRCENRQGDITIADFKGLSEVIPDFRFAKKNFSSLIANSRKGQEVIVDLKKSSILYQVSIEDIKKYNPLFFRQTWFSKDRDKFFKEYESNGIEAINKWTKPAQEYRPGIKQVVKNILPAKMLRVVYNLIYTCRKL